MSLKITVAICTSSRYELLPNAIESLANQTLMSSFFEILVIDNTGDAEISAAFWDDFVLPGNGRIVFSGPPNVSKARNRAIDECRAPLLCFLDDDAVAEQNWLEEIVQFFTSHAQLAVCGGPVLPIWPGGEPPTWLPPHYSSMLSILDYGRGDRMLAKGQHLCGTNIAFNTEILRGVGDYDERIGRTGSNSLMSNEEIVLQDKVDGAGYKKGYCANAIVYHQISESRLTRDWFRSRVAWQAVSEVIADDSSPFDFDGSMKQLVAVSQRLNLSSALTKMLRNEEGQKMDDQLAFVSHLLGVFLYSNQLKDESLLSAFTRLQDKGAS